VNPMKPRHVQPGASTGLHSDAHPLR
jgi:hypothetical protein